MSFLLRSIFSFAETSSLDTLDRTSHFTLKLLAIPLLLLLLAVLQARAAMALQHAMLVAVRLVAESAVARYTYNCILAVFERTANLLGAAAADGENHVESGLGGDAVGGEGRAGLTQVLAGMDDSHRRLWYVGAQGEQRAEGGDGGALGDGEREC